MHSPTLGRFVLVGSIALFVITTVIGNSFNGTQTFASLTGYRWVKAYIAVTVLAIFFGSLLDAKLVWTVADTLIVLAVVPNLIGLAWLAFKKPEVLRD